MIRLNVNARYAIEPICKSANRTEVIVPVVVPGDYLPTERCLPVLQSREVSEMGALMVASDVII